MLLQLRLLTFATLTLPLLGAVSCNGLYNSPTFICDASRDAGRLASQLRHHRLRVPAVYPNMGTRWTTTTIPVCWEDEAMVSVSYNDREIVHQAIEETWNVALSEVDLPTDSIYQFVGFKACSDDPAASAGGVHIGTTTGDPQTAGLGVELKGLSEGMQLNFTFKEWNKGGCLTANIDDVLRRHCVYAIAVHEFGHALGMAHEQNRTDTPKTCTEAPQGTSGNITLGEWDSQSVMNYCNPSWNNSGILSLNDQSGIRTVYYPQAAQDWCNAENEPLLTPEWPTPTPQGIML